MSNDLGGEGGRPEDRPRTLESYEQRTSNQPDVQQLHGPIYREKAEPRDGYQPIPVWLLLPMFALLLWGGWYLGEHSGDFRADVYEGPQAFVGSAGSAPQPTSEPANLMLLGRRVYNRCAACHQLNGNGVAGAYPPLAGAEWVTGDPRILARILLHGLQGPISVRGKKYNGAMPGWPNLRSEEIAAVMTYVRNSWGNEAGDVTASLVDEVRQAVGRRTSPWTATELEQVKSQFADPVTNAPPPAGDESEAEDDDVQNQGDVP